jgi:hypothetical protein
MDSYQWGIPVLRRASALLVLAVLLLAGCAAPKSTPGAIRSVDPSTPASPVADRGSIDGVVYDSEIQSLGGAAIILFGGSMKGEDLRTTAGKEGKFTFNDVAPGGHRIIADLAGYQSQTQNINIAAGEVTNVKFVLDKVVVRVYHPNLYKEENGTIAGPIVAFQGPNGREDAFVKFPVDAWPTVIFANLTWPCGTACMGPPESNYMNMEILDSDKVTVKKCTQETAAPNNKFVLSCKLDSFAKAGEYQVDIYAYEGRDIHWNLKLAVKY